MSTMPVVTASYTVASSTSPAAAQEAATATLGPLSFEAPIVVPSEEAPSAQAAKEQYLAALANALSSLQESINTGLTERLVQQGVLSETTDQDPNVNTKLRTKVPGQPNNSKKAQAKKQREQQQQQQQKNQAEGSSSTATAGAGAGAGESTSEGATTTTLQQGTTSADISGTDTAMEITPSSSDIRDVDMEDPTYRPKGGIYGDDDEDDDDEDNKDKDEVDLVMEADPGEVDGACLELPKEQQESLNKKRNEQPTDPTLDAAATKKPKGSSSSAD
ncbi:MAG: hypothetical protein J3Q66DRAFT_324018 [Benniella sp.]|nr:MAG: hypothetical protein J3Q66DRAFT_324018 [Benniella sp.]